MNDAGGVHLIDVGPRALLVEVEGAAQALDLATWARSARVGTLEVVPAATTVLFDGVDDLAALRSVLARWRPGTTSPLGEEVEIPLAYDGADLDAVAERWGTDRSGVRRRHEETAFVAAFCGFAPGFAYLSGLSEKLSVPRLATPRTRVPAGTVALADSWCGIYPTASPGGWLLLGHTDVELWDPAREPPALLVPGTRVRFVGR